LRGAAFLAKAMANTHAEQTENLRVVINQLRKKIEKDPAHPRYILTEPWMGYRFQFPSITSEKGPRRKS